MAATSTLKKVQVKAQLNNGTDSSGNVKTVAVTFPQINVSSYDASKALNIANALEPCLDKTVYTVEDVKTSELEEE